MAGGTLRINEGGKSIGATLASGIIDVKAGGVDSATTIGSGGWWSTASQIVSAGGSAIGTKIYGTQIVKGLAKNVTLYRYGELIVSKGGVVNGLTVTSGVSASDITNAGVISSWRLGKGVSMAYSGGYTLKGTTTVAEGASISGGTTSKRVSLDKGASLTAEKNADMSDLHLNVASGTLKLSGPGNTLGSVKLSSASNVVYDLSSTTAKTKSYMLYLSVKNTQKIGKFSIRVKKAQNIGTYELSKDMVQNAKTAYALNLGTTSLGTLQLNGSKLTKNGVTYSLESKNSQLNLSIAIKNGTMCKGTTGKDKLTGRAHSDIFYGSKGNDTITGKNGRDVAVYDKTAWGKDTIAKTSGTMTLLFKDLKASDIKKSLSGSTMTITKKSDSKQKITVKGWSNDTHNIVFGSKMTAFDKYIKATSPTTAQTTAARNEVFKKAGLASA